MIIDCDLLKKFDRPVPRYTSYPTAPQFYPIGENLFSGKLAFFDRTEKPLSLYIHIPFCKSMCLFCGCSVVLNRQPERQELYFSHLLAEIKMAARCFLKKRMVSQLHLGGGTPTSLTERQFEILMDVLRECFHFSSDAEISIEIDPRTVFADGGVKLSLLHQLGFNRVSFGVQDLDPAVQEAVKRRQTEEMTVTTYQRARDLGFDGINIDLIYGLPLQTAASFSKTAEKLIALKPDRIAFYSYAKIPWLKPHQKAINDSDLPTTDEKFRIYVEAREQFISGGYTAIGMDHFSLESDSIAKAYREKKLTRNFQGYAVQLADDMLGFGITSIGFLENCFFQNVKELEEYQAKIGKGELPVFRGFALSEEDILRRWTIQTLMCRFELDKSEFRQKFGVAFDSHFAGAKNALEQLQRDGLCDDTPDKISSTSLGRLFIRIVASVFDAYLIESGKYSRAI